MDIVTLESVVSLGIPPDQFLWNELHDIACAVISRNRQANTHEKACYGHGNPKSRVSCIEEAQT